MEMKAKACIYPGGKYFPHVHVGQDEPAPLTKWEKENPHTSIRCENGLFRENEIVVNYCGLSGSHEKIALAIEAALKVGRVDIKI